MSGITLGWDTCKASDPWLYCLSGLLSYMLLVCPEQQTSIPVVRIVCEVVYTCIPAGAGRGDVLAGVTKKQAAWLLGETLRDEELSVQKRLFNNLSIKL